jgi:hypothetical protein
MRASKGSQAVLSCHPSAAWRTPSGASTDQRRTGQPPTVRSTGRDWGTSSSKILRTDFGTRPVSFPRRRESRRAMAFPDPRLHGGDKRIYTHCSFCWRPYVWPAFAAGGWRISNEDIPDCGVRTRKRVVPRGAVLHRPGCGRYVLERWNGRHDWRHRPYPALAHPPAEIAGRPAIDSLSDNAPRNDMAHGTEKPRAGRTSPQNVVAHAPSALPTWVYDKIVAKQVIEPWVARPSAA